MYITIRQGKLLMASHIIRMTNINKNKCSSFDLSLQSMKYVQFLWDHMTDDSN